MCPQLALPFPKAFLWRPLTVLTRQTRQAVFAIIQPIFPRCLWCLKILERRRRDRFKFKQLKDSFGFNSIFFLFHLSKKKRSSFHQKDVYLRFIYTCDFVVRFAFSYSNNFPVTCMFHDCNLRL